MRLVLFISVPVLWLSGCATEQLVPLSRVPPGYTQRECRYQESTNAQERLQSIEYGGQPPDIVCSHRHAASEQSPEERAWQQTLAKQLDDPDVHKYVDALCARASQMTAAERTEEAQKLRDVYHLTATCLAPD